jgi:uncharacterized protein YeaC (DUF1315 family)
MDYQQLVGTMTLETYQNMKRSVELGKWPDGKPVTPPQREHAMAAIIAWGAVNLEEHDRVGYIDKGRKSGEVCDEPKETPLAWKN